MENTYTEKRIEIYDLEPEFDSAISFYKKARVEEIYDKNDELIKSKLYSYGSLVATLYPEKQENGYLRLADVEENLELLKANSSTTNRHLTEFLKQNIKTLNYGDNLPTIIEDIVINRMLNEKNSAMSKLQLGDLTKAIEEELELRDKIFSIGEKEENKGEIKYIYERFRFGSSVNNKRELNSAIKVLNKIGKELGIEPKIEFLKVSDNSEPFGIKSVSFKENDVLGKVISRDLSFDDLADIVKSTYPKSENFPLKPEGMYGRFRSSLAGVNFANKLASIMKIDKIDSNIKKELDKIIDNMYGVHPRFIFMGDIHYNSVFQNEKNYAIDFINAIGEAQSNIMKDKDLLKVKESYFEEFDTLVEKIKNNIDSGKLTLQDSKNMYKKEVDVILEKIKLSYISEFIPIKETENREKSLKLDEKASELYQEGLKTIEKFIEDYSNNKELSEYEAFCKVVDDFAFKNEENIIRNRLGLTKDLGEKATNTWEEIKKYSQENIEKINDFKTSGIDSKAYVSKFKGLVHQISRNAEFIIKDNKDEKFEKNNIDTSSDYINIIKEQYNAELQILRNDAQLAYNSEEINKINNEIKKYELSNEVLDSLKDEYYKAFDEAKLDEVQHKNETMSKNEKTNKLK